MASEDFGYMKDDDDKAISITKRSLLISVVLFSLIGFVYITINAYYSSNVPNGITTIKSPNFAIKVLDNDDGSDAADIDKAVYENIVGNKEENLRKDQIKVIKQPKNILRSKASKIEASKIEASKIEERDMASPLASNKLPIQKSRVITYDASKDKTLKQQKIKKTTIPKALPSSKTVDKNNRTLSRVQVVATSSKHNAEEYWMKLRSQYPKLTSGLRHFIYEADLGQKGVFYRLQVGNFRNQTAAEKFCNDFIAQAKKNKSDCIVVE